MLLLALNREFPALDARIPFPLILPRGYVSFNMNLLSNAQPRERFRIATVLASDLSCVSSVRNLERDSSSCPRASLAHSGLERKNRYDLSCKFNRHILVILLCVSFKFRAGINAIAVLFDEFPVFTLVACDRQIPPRLLLYLIVPVEQSSLVCHLEHEFRV